MKWLSSDVYDLQFTLVGNYVSITDFLYDIEDDEELKFQIRDLKIEKTETKVATTGTTKTNTNTNTTNTAIGSSANNTTKTNTTNTTRQTTDASEGGTILKATFTVQNIGITLD